MKIETFLQKLDNNPQEVSFEDTMETISAHYHYQACAFDNGPLHNASGTNEGSCKVFAFAQLNQLTDEQTLACFGDYYRIDVLEHPDGPDHANIRQFIKTGLQGIQFLSAHPLTEK